MSVYGIYDELGGCLYVGASFSVKARIIQHFWRRRCAGWGKFAGFQDQVYVRILWSLPKEYQLLQSEVETDFIRKKLVGSENFCMLIELARKDYYSLEDKKLLGEMEGVFIKSERPLLNIKRGGGGLRLPSAKNPKPSHVVSINGDGGSSQYHSMLYRLSSSFLRYS